MKYLFILGRNIELSVAEIKSFLRKEEIGFEVLGLAGNGLLIEIGEKLSKIIDNLGGTIAIGEVLASGSADEISRELDKTNLYSGNSNKLNYLVYDFNAEELDDILLYLKKRFRNEELKATLKKPTGRIKLQSGEEAFKTSSRLIDEQYFVFKDNFGKLTEFCDYEKIEKRDMEKPVRRNELSISPRLAKILINLSEIKQKEILLDPFCGIGTILSEALLQGIKVIGIDKERGPIHNCHKNLKWLGFSREKYKLIIDDSSKAKVNADAIATEPQLGELQRGLPSQQKAKEIIASFEKLMIEVLNNLKNSVKGRIAFTSPMMQINRKKFSCDFEKISFETGLKIVKGFPIDEFRESSFIGRSVVVMEK